MYVIINTKKGTKELCNMRKEVFVFKVEYYEEDKYFGWLNRVHDNVIAKSEKEAMSKFYSNHGTNVIATIVNWIRIDY